MKLHEKVSAFFSEKLVSRRSFLKGSATAGAAATMMGLVGCSTEEETPDVQDPVTPDVQEPTPAPVGTLTHQACPRNCHDTCSIISEVVDGKIVKISGNKDNVITAGGLCVKMNHYMSWVYSPDRVLYPMKRVGAKGEGKFEQITWDEALATIADKTKAAIDQYGSETVLPYSYSGNLGMVQNYGAPNSYFNRIASSRLQRTVCASAGDAAIPYTYGADNGLDPEQYPNTKLYVSWGINEAATNVHALKFIKECKENGGKILVVNPVRIPIANFADQFVQIKPGTDAAFALGVANYIIENNMQDQAYIDANTIGYDELKAKAAEYTLARTAEITGVSEQEIIDFATTYAGTKPSILKIGYGIQRNSNGGSMIRAITLLPALVGTIGMGDNSGYTYINAAYWKPNYSGLTSPEFVEGMDLRRINMNEIGKALTGDHPLTSELPITVLMVYNSNPVAITQNVGLVRKGLAREDLFTVVMDIFRTDTADYADIILPACTFFEYEDLNQDYLGFYVRYNQPAIAPLGESKSNMDMFAMIAKAMGYTDSFFDMTSEEAMAVVLDQVDLIDQGITYEKLKADGFAKIHVDTPYKDKVFKTPSGKIEFYSETLGETGLHPVADYVPTAESSDGDPALFAKYPLTLVTPATKNLLNSQMHSIPQIQELMGEPVVFVNTEDAASRGIADGDKLRLYNDRGETILVARVSADTTRKGTLLAFNCPWPKLIEGGTSVNELTSDRLTDIGFGSTYHTNLVEIAKM